MKSKETIERAYGHIPNEPVSYIDFDILTFRGIKYYWLRLVRFITR